MTDDEHYMMLAMREADKARAVGEVPCGCVIVKEGAVIATGWNQVETLGDATAHAEMLALRAAENAVGDWRLEGCTVYVTKEPCPMCAWAIIQSRIKAVYFGAYDENYGALGSKIDLRPLLSSKLKVYGGIMEDECNKILKDYFEGIR